MTPPGNFHPDLCGDAPSALPKSRSRHRWDDDEMAVLTSSFDKPLSEVMVMLAAIASKRTASAVDSKLYELRRRAEGHTRRPSMHAFPQRGWPSTPSPEVADGIFVRRLVEAMRAEGLVRP